jgi:hypothetical protein
VSGAAAVLFLAAALAAWRPQAEDAATIRETPVGVPARIEALVLPGGELEAVPGDFAAPIVLRVLATWPHGSAFRYDLEYYGLEPGEHDLARWLRRKDGSESGDLPPIPVTIAASLPEGPALPNPSPAADVPARGGYRALLVALAVLWLAGLVAIALGFRRARAAAQAGDAPPPTLAERLRPLVVRAARGELPPQERAALELMLIAHWRRRLALDALPPDEALALLREHEAAGPLLRGLEAWLHRPEPPDEAEIARLLEPYRDARDEVVAAEAAPAAHGGA